jgi:PAS domain S-box-containing protein
VPDSPSKRDARRTLPSLHDGDRPSALPATGTRASTRWFEESPTKLRRLALLLYLFVGPPFVAAMLFTTRPAVRTSVTLIAGGLIAAGALWMAALRPRKPWYWVFPAAIVPTSCCGIAFASSGGSGLVFLAAMSAPLAWAGALFEASVVLAAWLTAIGWFVGAQLALGVGVEVAPNAALYAVIMGLVGWVLHGKTAHLRDARLLSLERHLLNDIELVMDAEGTIVRANDRAAAAYGRSVESLKGLSIKAIRKDSPERVSAQLADLLARGELVFETTHARADGSSFPVEVSARTFTSGGVLYMHSLIRDISARRRAEAEKRLLGWLVEHMQEAVIVIDTEGRVVSWSSGATRMFGFTEKEMVGTDLFSRIAPGRTKAEAEALWARVREQGSVQRTAARTRADGTEIITDAVVAPVRDETGNVTGYFSVSRDITEATRAAEALRASEEQLSRVLEGSEEGFWEWSSVTAVLTVSPRFSELFGRRDIHDLETWGACVHAEDRGATGEAWYAHQRGEAERFDVEYRVPRSDGGMRWVHARGRAVELDLTGRPLRVAGTVLDITERRETQARLEQALTENQRHVEELLAALQQVKTLSGLLPICAWCKKMRDDDGFWMQVEAYLSRHTDARFTHGMCPDCAAKMEAEGSG